MLKSISYLVNFRSKDEVLREQLAKYKRIFEQSEIKVKLLSDTFREYLNKQQENQNNELNDEQKRSTPNTERRKKKGAGDAMSTTGRKNRGTGRQIRNHRERSSEVATTNLNDVELLESNFHFFFFCFLPLWLILNIH